MERKTGPTLTKDQSGLLKYWVSKCRDGKMPVRRDVTPADLIFCLPSISIVEHRTCGNFVFRMTGSALREILGVESRGHKLKDICGHSIPWHESLNQAVSTKSPVLGQTPIASPRVHSWMRLPLQTMDDGCQPILCYDRIEVVEARAFPRRETMFVTANAFRRGRARIEARSVA